MIWAVALVAAAQVSGAMLDWKAAGIEPLDWKIIGGGERMALFVRQVDDIPVGHVRIWLRYEGVGEAILETPMLPGGKAASVTELDELDCANHKMGSVQKTAYSQNNLKGASRVLVHRGEPFGVETPDPKSILAEIFTFCPANPKSPAPVGPSPEIGTTASDEEAFLASPEHLGAVKGMTPFFMCVRTKITELKRRAPDHSAGVQAVRNACKSELIAYSKWLDDQGYNRWSKGFELTALQRTIDKIIADAGNSAPADPAH